MLAMQYSFTFPADYDMAIIERRIAENGHRLDGFPGLLFKAYLYARRSVRISMRLFICGKTQKACTVFCSATDSKR
jgi:hypothetical protein